MVPMNSSQKPIYIPNIKPSLARDFFSKDIVLMGLDANIFMEN